MTKLKDILTESEKLKIDINIQEKLIKNLTVNDLFDIWPILGKNGHTGIVHVNTLIEITNRCYNQNKPIF